MCNYREVFRHLLKYGWILVVVFWPLGLSIPGIPSLSGPVEQECGLFCPGNSAVCRLKQMHCICYICQIKVHTINSRLFCPLNFCVEEMIRQVKTLHWIHVRKEKVCTIKILHYKFKYADSWLICGLLYPFPTTLVIQN